MINWNKKENIPNNTDWNSSQEDDLEKYVDRIVSALFEKVESKNNEIQKVEKIEELEETKKAVIEDSICTERLEKMVGARKKAEFVDDERDSILKNAIDNGFIKENEVVFCLNHFIAFNRIIEEDSKKIYVFTDSLPIFYKKLKKEGGENCQIDENTGIIKASENSGILNIEESSEKRIGILKLLF